MILELYKEKNIRNFYKRYGEQFANFLGIISDKYAYTYVEEDGEGMILALDTDDCIYVILYEDTLLAIREGFLCEENWGTTGLATWIDNIEKVVDMLMDIKRSNIQHKARK